MIYITKNILFYISNLGLGLIAARLSLFYLLEKIIPAESKQPFKGYVLNIKITLLNQIIFFTVVQGVSSSTIAFFSNKYGYGFFDLRFINNKNHIFCELAIGLLTYFIYDFFYYWMHRAQHYFNFFWYEHKLHHLEENLNASTSSRHHWLEEFLRIPFINLPVFLLFKLDPLTAGITTTLFSLWGTFIHANLRIEFGFISKFFGGPQVHRIHHSKLEKHFNKNFAAFFPIWDIIFNTYYHPQKNEFPPTGITNEHLSSFKQALFLPFKLFVNYFNNSKYLLTSYLKNKFIKLKTISIDSFLILFIYFILIKLPVFILSYEKKYIFFGDDDGYYWLSSSDFLTMILVRPLVYPLYIKLLFKNVDAIFCGQFLISTLAWAFFSRSALLKIEFKPLKIALLILISLLASSIYITNWDVKILTESLSISFLLISIGCLFKKNPTTSKNLIIFILSECLLIGLRDSSYLMALPLLLLLLSNKNIRKKQKWLASIIISMFTIFIVVTSYYGERQRVNFEDVLAFRIIPNQEYFDWYLKKTSMPDIKQDFEKCASINGPYLCLPRASKMFLGIHTNTADYEQINKDLVKNFPYLLKLLSYVSNKYLLTKDYFYFLSDHMEYFYLNNWQNFSFYEHWTPIIPSVKFAQSSTQFLDGVSYESYGGDSRILRLNKFRDFSKFQYKFATTILFVIGIILLLTADIRTKFLIACAMVLSYILALITYIVEPMEFPRHCLTGNLLFILIIIIAMPNQLHIRVAANLQALQQLYYHVIKKKSIKMLLLHKTKLISKSIS